MAARDNSSAAIINALIKNGWNITADPYTLWYGGRKVEIDLAAEKLLAAERGGEQIAVEIKSFIGQSPVHDLELALGQYNLYVSVLKRLQPGRRLFLAVGDLIYEALLEIDMFRLVVEDYQMAIVVIELDTEEVIRWIP